MKIFVNAKPSAKEEKLIKVSETNFIVWVKEPPIKGRANKAIAAVLASHFKIVPSRLNLVSGYSSRKKVFELLA